MLRTTSLPYITDLVSLVETAYSASLTAKKKSASYHYGEVQKSRFRHGSMRSAENPQRLIFVSNRKTHKVIFSAQLAILDDRTFLYQINRSR